MVCPLHRRAMILLLLGSLAQSGCRNLAASLRPQAAQPPMLPETATYYQVADYINANTQKVSTLYAPQATISGPGIPRLGTTIAYERPRKFRLQAKFLGSTQVDMGSNDRAFWIWSEQNKPSAILYAEHDQFAEGRLAQVLPVDMEWLADALGLVTLSPTDQHSEPVPLGSGLVKITTRMSKPTGDIYRVLVFHPGRGEIVQQLLYDSAQNRIASASLSRYLRDPATGAHLPTEIKVDWPTMGRSFTMDLGKPEVNGMITQISPTMWQMPQVTGAAAINLADPNQVAGYFGQNSP